MCQSSYELDKKCVWCKVSSSAKHNTVSSSQGRGARKGYRLWREAVKHSRHFANLREQADTENEATQLHFSKKTFMTRDIPTTPHLARVPKVKWKEHSPKHCGCRYSPFRRFYPDLSYKTALSSLDPLLSLTCARSPMTSRRSCFSK